MKYSALIFGIMLLVSCKKKQPAMDITGNCNFAGANFKMGEKYGDEFVELDTIAMPIYYADGNPGNFNYINDVYVYFSADIENAISYEWQVGSNPVTQTTKEFGLYFSDTIGTIPVRLIVHSVPNHRCFPDDDGIDTVTKYLTIRTVIPDPLAGSYYGYNTNDPGNFFTIKIDTVTKFVNGFGNSCGLAVNNLPNGNSNWEFIGDDLGCTTRSFTNAGGTSQPYSGNFVLYDQDGSYLEQSTTGIYYQSSNEIRINYYSAPVIDQFTLGTPFPKRTFIGKKIL